MEDRKCGSLLNCSIVLFFLLMLRSELAMAVGNPVKYLPGFQGQLPFHFETGYIGVGPSEEIQLFYYFIESETNPENDPFILWLVGGPGTAALYAILNEMGPLRFDNKEYNGSLPTLSYHPYGYTKVANILFVDSPVGAGFSYDKTKSGKYWNTQQVAEQTYQFLRKWLVENPKYQSHPFYVGGDAYGGIFVPITTQVISDGIEAGMEPKVDLKGYFLGNPVTFLDDERNKKIPFAHGMALISDELYESLQRHCGGEYQTIDPKNTLCLQYVQTFNKVLTGVYEYNILDPICDTTISTKVQNTSSQRRSLHEKFENLKSPMNHPGMKCRGDWLALSNYWANDDAVREALHVRKGTVGVWEYWKQDIPFTRSVNNSVPYHAYLSTKNYRSLIYSGDHDMNVPFQSTQAWVKSLNYSITEDWRPWMVDGQVGGFTRTYSNRMTYATVRGSGHCAPEWTPAECLAIVKRWLSNNPL